MEGGKHELGFQKGEYCNKLHFCPMFLNLASCKLSLWVLHHMRWWLLKHVQLHWVCQLILFMRQIFDRFFFLQTAASYCASNPQNPEASQVLDLAVCCRSPDMLPFYDNVTDSWNISHLGELDIHHDPQHFSFIGSEFVGDILPCLCKRVGTSQASCKVPVHQRNCFLLLLAGKVFSSNGIRSSVGVLLFIRLVD